MQESKNINDLLSLIDWAGSISDLMLTPGAESIEDYDVPDDLKDAWEEAAQLIGDVKTLMDHYYHEYDERKHY